MRSLTVPDLPPRVIQDVYPRLIGGLCLLWTVIFQRGALDWSSDALWLAVTALWVASALTMALGRLTHVGAAGLVIASIVQLLDAGSHLHVTLALVLWLNLIIALTHRRPEERALLVRVMVTSVYAFTALAKLNPSFLAGEQLVAMSIERSQISWMTDVLRTPLGPVMAWMTVAVEAGLAVALWFRRSRVVAVLIGTPMHLVFMFVAHNNTVWDMAFVTILNLALVLSYLAFFSPVPRPMPDPIVPARPIGRRGSGG